MSAWRDVARRYAFVEYDGPPLEPLDLYTRKSGDEIVGQLYNFTDKGEREVALRPEMTPTVARMVAARANALRKPVRWFSIPQLFRYERQQRGRLREHFQLNVDIVGASDVAADAEARVVRRRHHARVRAHVSGCGGARVRSAAAPGVPGVAWRARRRGGCGVPGDRQARAHASRRVSGTPCRAWRWRGCDQPYRPHRRRHHRPSASPACRWYRGATGARSSNDIWPTRRRCLATIRGSTSICPSCAASRTTPASCSSCSTLGRVSRHLWRRTLRHAAGRTRRRGPAGARVRHGRRGARRAARDRKGLLQAESPRG